MAPVPKIILDRAENIELVPVYYWSFPPQNHINKLNGIHLTRWFHELCEARAILYSSQCYFWT